jgi:hypothetical protein
LVIFGTTSCRIGFEFAFAHVIQQGLGQNTPSRVMGAKKKYIQGLWFSHCVVLLNSTSGAHLLSEHFAGLPLTTVLREEAQNGIHPLVLCTVDQMAAHSLLTDQLRRHQLFQVKGQCVCRQAQFFHQISRGQSLWPFDHQGPKNLQSMGLSQRRERFDDVFFFHFSIILEIYDYDPLYLIFLTEVFAADPQTSLM